VIYSKYPCLLDKLPKLKTWVSNVYFNNLFPQYNKNEQNTFEIFYQNWWEWRKSFQTFKTAKCLKQFLEKAFHFLLDISKKEIPNWFYKKNYFLFSKSIDLYNIMQGITFIESFKVCLCILFNRNLYRISEALIQMKNTLF